MQGDVEDVEILWKSVKNGTQLWTVYRYKPWGVLILAQMGLLYANERKFIEGLLRYQGKCIQAENEYILRKLPYMEERLGAMGQECPPNILEQLREQLALHNL